jgi:hypothetical protein
MFSIVLRLRLKRRQPGRREASNGGCSYTTFYCPEDWLSYCGADSTNQFSYATVI